MYSRYELLKYIISKQKFHYDFEADYLQKAMKQLFIRYSQVMVFQFYPS